MKTIKIAFRELLQNTVTEVKEALSHKNYNSSELNLEPFSNFSIQFGQKYETPSDDLSLLYEESEKNVIFTVFYNENYPDYVVERLLKDLINILSDYEDLLKKNIKEYSFIDEAEFHQLLVEFNDTKLDYPRDKTIVELFEDQVCKTPDNVAVVFEDTELTYRELNEQANQLGDYLRQNYQIKPDDLVGIKLERSFLVREMQILHF